MKESRVVLLAGEANGKQRGKWAPEIKWDRGKSMEHSWPWWRYRAGSREHWSGDTVREWAARESAKNRSASRRSGAEKQSQPQLCSLLNGGLLGFCFFLYAQKVSSHFLVRKLIYCLWEVHASLLRQWLTANRAFSSNTWAEGENQRGRNLPIQCPDCVEVAEDERIRI